MFPVINRQTMEQILHADLEYKMASGWADTPGYLKRASKLTFFVAVDEPRFIKCLARIAAIFRLDCGEKCFM